MLVESFARFLVDVGFSALLITTVLSVNVLVGSEAGVILVRAPMFPQDFLAPFRVETVVGWVKADCCWSELLTSTDCLDLSSEPFGRGSGETGVANLDVG